METNWTLEVRKRLATLQTKRFVDYELTLDEWDELVDILEQTLTYLENVWAALKTSQRLLNGDQYGEDNEQHSTPASP